MESQAPDPFIARLLSQAPAGVAESFSDAQLRAVKSAFEHSAGAGAERPRMSAGRERRRDTSPRRITRLDRGARLG